MHHSSHTTTVAAAQAWLHDAPGAQSARDLRFSPNDISRGARTPRHTVAAHNWVAEVLRGLEPFIGQIDSSYEDGARTDLILLTRPLADLPPGVVGSALMTPALRVAHLDSGQVSSPHGRAAVPRRVEALLAAAANRAELGIDPPVHHVAEMGDGRLAKLASIAYRHVSGDAAIQFLDRARHHPLLAWAVSAGSEDPELLHELALEHATHIDGAAVIQQIISSPYCLPRTIAACWDHGVNRWNDRNEPGDDLPAGRITAAVATHKHAPDRIVLEWLDTTGSINGIRTQGFDRVLDAVAKSPTDGRIAILARAQTANDKKAVFERFPLPEHEARRIAALRTKGPLIALASTPHPLPEDVWMDLAGHQWADVRSTVAANPAAPEGAQALATLMG